MSMERMIKCVKCKKSMHILEIRPMSKGYRRIYGCCGERETRYEVEAETIRYAEKWLRYVEFMKKRFDVRIEV